MRNATKKAVKKAFGTLLRAWELVKWILTLRRNSGAPNPRPSSPCRAPGSPLSPGQEFARFSRKQHASAVETVWGKWSLRYFPCRVVARYIASSRSCEFPS